MVLVTKTKNTKHLTAWTVGITLLGEGQLKRLKTPGCGVTDKATSLLLVTIYCAELLSIVSFCPYNEPMIGVLIAILEIWGPKSRVAKHLA